VAHNIRAMVELAQRARDDRTGLYRLTDKVARIAGSTPFLVIHAVWLVELMGLNATVWCLTPIPQPAESGRRARGCLPHQRGADDTNHDAAGRPPRALDLQVNLLAEQELTAIPTCRPAPRRVDVAIRDERQQLPTETDIRQISVALDRGMDARSDQ
jgi:uncharacterized membrane protein